MVKRLEVDAGGKDRASWRWNGVQRVQDGRDAAVRRGRISPEARKRKEMASWRW